MRIANKKILAVSSGGGHWIELLRVASAFEGHETAYISVDAGYRSDVPSNHFYVVRDVTRWNRIRWIQTVFQLIWIMIREKPDIVISTGALPGYFAVRLAKSFRKRTIWIDSIANVDELSLSGQKIGKYADLWLTQWPHLATPDGPYCYGAIL